MKLVRVFWQKSTISHGLAIALGSSLLLGLPGCANNPDPYMQQGFYNASPQSLPQAQLESLVSPIALYPDSLLSLMLLASTYPLEVAEAYNWRMNNSQLSGASLQSALKTQSWNDSVKSLMNFPQAFNMMGNQLQWTQNLGNAYKLQPAQTMQAIQALRKRAMQAGSLKSNQQMTVTTNLNDDILINPPNTQVVYVPSYNPTVVYGSWPYPEYPPYPAYNPAWGAMAFGLGFAVGDAFWAAPEWTTGNINVNSTNPNGIGNRGVIGPSNIQNQQRLLNDWKNNATPQEKQAARADASRATNAFDRNATPEERAQADRMNQEARNAYQQDRLNPNLYREAAQENALRDQARFDANADRYGGDRFGGDRFGGGGFRGGFGGGRMGGFRR